MARILSLDKEGCQQTHLHWLLQVVRLRVGVKACEAEDLSQAGP